MPMYVIDNLRIPIIRDQVEVRLVRSCRRCGDQHYGNWFFR